MAFSFYGLHGCLLRSGRTSWPPGQKYYTYNNNLKLIMTFINGNNGPMPFRPLFERHGVWKTNEQRFFNLSLYLVTTLGWQHKCRTRSSDFNDPDTVLLCVFSSSSTVSYLFPCAESYKEFVIQS